MPTLTHRTVIPISRIDDVAYVDAMYEQGLMSAWREFTRTWPEDTWQAVDLQVNRPNHDAIEWERLSDPHRGEVFFEYTFTVMPMTGEGRADDARQYIPEPPPHIYDKKGGHRVAIMAMTKRQILNGLWFRLRFFLWGPVLAVTEFLDGRYEQTMNEIDRFGGRETSTIETERAIQGIRDMLARMNARLDLAADAARGVEDVLADEYIALGIPLRHLGGGDRQLVNRIKDEAVSEAYRRIVWEGTGEDDDNTFPGLSSLLGEANEKE